MDFQIGLDALKRHEFVRWDGLGGISLPGLVLPNERGISKVFSPAAAEYIRSIKRGIYREGVCVESYPPTRNSLFPFVAEHSLSYAAMESKTHPLGLIPGERLHTELKDGFFGLILSRTVHQQEEYVILNSGHLVVLDLGPWWYQGRDRNGPMAVIGEQMHTGQSMIGREFAQNEIEALLWPLDLSKEGD